MKGKNIKYMCVAGVLAAFVFVLTAFVHIPVGIGYVHMGDGIVYLAACLLPLPYGMVVGALGAALSDCLTGFALWAPCSVVIKAATVLCFSQKKSKIICPRNLIGLLPAWVLCVGGYYIYEAVITMNFASPLASVLGNVMQVVASSLVFAVLGVALDSMKAKDRLLR